jgi:thioredoxin reductase/Pyruvate/2-oxoacid:ferredoxin oxidoreductase delta subunit
MLVKITTLISQYLTLFGAGFFVIVTWYYLSRKHKAEIKAVATHKKAIAKDMGEPATLHPQINSKLCAGCGACVKVCPEGEIIQLINHKAVLVTPSKCVGHGECEVVCPFGAIDLVFGTKQKGMEIPRVSSDYETNVKGLYIAGELGGMGLIRNAIKQGALATAHAIKTMPKDGPVKTHVDLLIIGCGPAGLAAALKAKELGKSYLCIEQDSVGGAVYNFPRQKVVMSQPAELPIVGKMKFSSNKVSKEELLGYWNSIKTQQQLNIKEKTKFEKLKRENNVFNVETSRGLIVAKKVILALGVRGSPRKLGIKNEEMSKVTYNLLDPEQYQKQYVCVVGGGNAAAEAAQYLAKPQYGNKTLLIVRGGALSKANEENVNLVNELEKQGRLIVWYNSAIKEIQKDHIIVEKDGQLANIPNNFIFIFAGALMPFDFLMSLGIKIDKKHGEKLKKVGAR